MTPDAKPLVRVVVAEDSNVQRAHLVRVLEADGDIQVVGQATTAAEAITEVKKHRPDVVTVDLQIRGNGHDAIEQIMANTPTPILVVSGQLDDERSPAAIDALVAGALEAMPKPSRWGDHESAMLRKRVRALHGVAVVRHPRGRLATTATTGPGRAPATVTAAPGSSGSVSTSADSGRRALLRATGSRALVVGIAASTGGPPALAQILSDLDGVEAPIVVVQHIHADFVNGLIAWMRRAGNLDVRLAEHNEALRADVVYIAPAGTHLRVGRGPVAKLDPDPPTRHRPSADELFRSIAEQFGAAGMGVVLTGMGDDGARGLLALRERGGLTVAQDEASSAVFGMPKAAHAVGAVSGFTPLDRIASTIVGATKRRP